VRWAAGLLAVLVWTSGVARAQTEFSDAYAAAEQLRLGGKASVDDIAAAYREALGHYRRLPEAAREDAQWLPTFAFCAQQAGDAGLAADLFRASLDAGNRDAFHAESLLIALLQSDRAEQVLRDGPELEQAFPDAVRTALYRAKAWESGDRWLRRGATEPGLWVFEALARAAAEDAASTANLALARRSVGLEQEAVATYERALEKAPEDPSLWNDLGLTLKGMGRRDEAAERFVTSRRLEPQPPTGPATTNLVRMAQRGGAEQIADPAAAMAQVLRARPTAGLARRVYLDVLTRRLSGQ